MLSELLYADDLVLMSETIEGFRNKFINWKAFESKCLKINFWKVMVGDSITKDGLSKSHVDPCVVCSLIVPANFLGNFFLFCAYNVVSRYIVDVLV